MEDCNPDTRLLKGSMWPVPSRRSFHYLLYPLVGPRKALWLAGQAGGEDGLWLRCLISWRFMRPNGLVRSPIWI